MVLLDTGTPGTSREIYSEDADGDVRLCPVGPLYFSDEKLITVEK